MQTLTVYLREIHTCSLKPAVVQNDDHLTEAIQQNANLGPAGINRRKLLKEVQQAMVFISSACTFIIRYMSDPTTTNIRKKFPGLQGQHKMSRVRMYHIVWKMIQ